MDSLYEEQAVLLAPLAGYTDWPFRRAARRCGCRYAFTEMIDAAALVYARARTEKMLVRGDDEPWLGVQLVSGDAGQLRQAVGILNSCEFDVIDFNLGCPVPKIARKGAGAALGRNIEKAVELFGMIADGSRFPATCKIRVLDAADPEPTVELVTALAARGARAITIHGRVMEAFYSGDVAFDVIDRCIEAVDIPVIANGGITGRHSYCDARERCAASRYMVARGAMGNPWIFRELAEGGDFVPPDLACLVETAKIHVLDMLDFYGEAKGSALARKIVLDYFRGRGFNGDWRGRAGLLSGKSEFMTYMDSAPLYHSADYWKTPPDDRRIGRSE